MKAVYDNQGNYKGLPVKLNDIKDDWIRNCMEGFVRAGCYIFENPQGIIAAIPGYNAKLVEVEQ